MVSQLHADVATAGETIVPRRILLVEDDPLITRAIVLRLEAAGHAVSTAADVSHAVDDVLGEPPDVVLLDVNLPDGNGLQLAERMRRLRGTAAVPLIVITASRDPRYREMAERLAVPYLEKPFTAKVLLDEVERACARSGRLADGRWPQAEVVAGAPVLPPRSVW